MSSLSKHQFKRISPYSDGFYILMDFQNCRMLHLAVMLQCPLRTTIVLVVQLLLAHFCRGNLHTNTVYNNDSELEETFEHWVRPSSEKNDVLQASSHCLNTPKHGRN